jgi:hypothetical protein
MSKRFVLLYGLLVATLGAQAPALQCLKVSNCAFLDVASNRSNQVNDVMSSDIHVIQHRAPVLVNLMCNDDERAIYGTVTGEPGAVIQWSFQRMGKIGSAPVVLRGGLYQA